MYATFSLEDPKKGNHPGDLSVHERIILKWILSIVEVVDWIHLAQDRTLWQALVNTAMSLRFP
jgi:hypothetical protein